MGRRAKGAGMLLAALAALACRSSAPFPYVRLSGEAPPSGDRANVYFFWAEWCAPCVEELPGIVALAADPVAGVAPVLVVQGPTLDALPADARAARGLAVRHDPQGQLAGRLRVSTLPAAVLAADGRLVARFDGLRRWDGPAARETLARLAGAGGLPH